MGSRISALERQLQGWYTPDRMPYSPRQGTMIVLAYLWPLALVPLIAEPEDQLIQWHARHGLVLAVAEAALLITFGLLTSFVGLAAFGIGLAIFVVTVFVWIALGVHLLAIVRALGGTRLSVPGLTALADRF